MINKAVLPALITFAIVVSSATGHIEAAEFRSGLEVVISADEVLNEDVYAVARRVVVDGTINGDLVAAGESIEVNGSINGDLIVAARAVMVSGAVEDDIRAAGADLRFQSSIGGDLITAGAQILVEADSVIGEDLVANANSLITRGEVRGDLDLNVVEATIAGTVRGSVAATVEENLILAPDATIEGGLTYTSVNTITTEPGAEVAGDLNQLIPTLSIFGREFQISTLIEVFTRIIEQIKWLIGTILIGLILIWLVPKTMRNVAATFSNSPWKSFGVGVVLLPLTPVILLLAMIVTLPLAGFSVFPVVAVPAAFYAVVLLLAKPAIALSIGSLISRQVLKRQTFTPGSTLAIGAATLAVAGLIPFIDSVVGWLSLLLGFGMWLLYFYRRYREARVESTA